jgi:hypothetical protein
MAPPERATAPTTSATAAGARTHHSKKRILSDLGPACAAGTAGPEFWKRIELRAEQTRDREKCQNLPRFSLFSLVNFR